MERVGGGVLPYNAMFYAIDNSLPIIDFGYKDGWRPHHERRLAVYYLFGLRIAGAVLLPVALLALTGVIK
jgi:hypothetical protein